MTDIVPSIGYSHTASITIITAVLNILKLEYSLQYTAHFMPMKFYEMMLTIVEPATAGTFLLRDSFSSNGDFVLSLRYDSSKTGPAVEHYRIIRNKYDIYYKLMQTSSRSSEIHGK